MSTATLFVHGRIGWLSELRETNSGSAMRSALIFVDGGAEDESLGVFARVFGSDAEAMTKGDMIAVEGPVEIGLAEHKGESKPRLSVMARWSRLSSHAGDRRRRSEAARRGADKEKGGGHQQVIDGFALIGGQRSASPPTDNNAPFDDPIGF
ncbi:MAG: hypothetical protein OEU92_22090 [Alphaproteobacteria bacterium]|nr:hypothetical protein [Alphaproteobacteria bacterium]